MFRQGDLDLWRRKVYEEAITFADRLYITLIESVFEGDVFFPDWEDFFNQKSPP